MMTRRELVDRSIREIEREDGGEPGVGQGF